MPTYAYQCDSCGNEFEVFQKMSDDPIDTCECGEKGQVRRLIGSGAGLIFKGSGFYITDYKNGSSGKAKPEPAKSESSRSESKKSESSSASGGCGSANCCMND